MYMKKNILLFIIAFLLTPVVSQAQIDENPINTLVNNLAQNDMLTKRFYRNYLFVKSNIFKENSIRDTDRSIALFDNNLTALSLFLPDNKDVEENYIKLQNYWNVYRLKVTDYERNNYGVLARNTDKFVELYDDFNKSTLKLHPQYGQYKKTIEKVNRIVENEKLLENIAINYVLTRGLKQKEAANFFSKDMGAVKSNLKKLGKDKKLQPELKDLLLDMQETTKNIESLLTRASYHPKLMYSYIKNVSNKSFQFVKLITAN